MKFASILTLLCLSLAAAKAETPKQLTLVTKAHAHNDYEHKRPLIDALEQGFCSVEADIFLTKEGSLLVAHTALGLKKENTLQKLYLDPLKERVKANGGHVHAEKAPFYLLIDIKTDAKTTYAALANVLKDYAEILTVTENGKTTRGPITAVISGNTDRASIIAESKRYAAIDGRPSDLDSNDSADLIPWISASWASQFKWYGTGEMPESEKTQLKDYVAKAHAKGRMVRFWATPDKPAAWGAQLGAGVDLINTDKLPELRAFLLKQK